MEFHEFGNVKHPKLLLIHGMAMTWELCFEKIIGELSKEYYLIVPAIDGHNRDKQCEFKCLDDVVKKIEEYILHRYIPDLYGGFGFSMGGTILLKLMEKQNIRFQKVILDASYYLPLGIYSKFISTIITKIIAELRQQKPLHPMYEAFLNFANFDIEFLEKAIAPEVSERSIKNCLFELSNFHLTKPLSISTDVTYWYGSKELFPPKAVEYVKQVLPQTKVKKFEGFGHGELITKHPDQALEEMRKIFTHK